MPINQPSNQVKLTNVSVVRLKKGGKRFEVSHMRVHQSMVLITVDRLPATRTKYKNGGKGCKDALKTPQWTPLNFTQVKQT